MENIPARKQTSIPTLLGLAVVLALIAGLMLSLSNISKQQEMYAIATFDQCKAAGYPIMESYPEQCATPDGRTFTNDAPAMQMPPPRTGVVADGCMVTGCSMQLCLSASEAAAGSVSTCEFRPEYACYRDAACEMQGNGVCGWTETVSLTQCLASPPEITDPQVM